MSSSTLDLPAANKITAPARTRRPRGPRSLSASGEPLIWLSGGGLCISLAMIVCLLCWVIYQGLATFWPIPLVEVTLKDGRKLLGEISRGESYQPNQGVNSIPAAQGGAPLYRRLFRTGNFELTNTHFQWVDDSEIAAEELPAWAMTLERLSAGRFYGLPAALLVDGKEQTSEPSEIWSRLKQMLPEADARRKQRLRIERDELGPLNEMLHDARLDVKAAEMRHGASSPQVAAAEKRLVEVDADQQAQGDEIKVRIDALVAANNRYALRMATADGASQDIPLEQIVRVYPANQLGFGGRLGVYMSRWVEFLAEDPRSGNTEGGVWPAIFGTVTMTLLMSLAVAPFGVLAALYLREYAKAGFLVSAVRIAINNLAGVPSIVFGVFGLGFFCYFVGGQIDRTFFPLLTSEGTATFGTGGVLWASLTLALLTLPVVIVTTEEALAAVPGSTREGSYACGASKWQTIKRVVLPRAMPGILTGMILAMARGAGEVAPLMLVGAMKVAPKLPVDGTFPYLHAERSFMHLGFQIFDLGFHSPNSEAAKPMVYTTTLLLIAIIGGLNVAAVYLRARLRRRFQSNHF